MSAEIAERDRMLIELDLLAAAKIMPDTSDDVRIVAMHKARYECTSIDDPSRHKSGEWLRERGYGRMYGMELLPKGELPV